MHPGSKYVRILVLTALLSAPALAQDLIGSCGDLPDALRSCSEFNCKFTHPFTGETMERRIKGQLGDDCLYQESMPNAGELNCAYSEEMRDAVADFYQSSFAGEEPEQNPLNEALADGTCKVTGY